jgi:hypothetical protein
MNDILTRFVIRSNFANFVINMSILIDNLEPHLDVIVEWKKENLSRGSIKMQIKKN